MAAPASALTFKLLTDAIAGLAPTAGPNDFYVLVSKLHEAEIKALIS